MDELRTESPVPLSPLKVGIVYNLKGNTAKHTEDEDAEYDSIDTVYAIRNAIEKHGLKTCLIEADVSLSYTLRAEKPDIVFNIAEGIAGRGREAQVPAVLNMLGIPFTGSDETTLCIALDKALTKRLVRTYRVRTPDYAVIHSGERFTGHINFPAIVKPDNEGSSKGILDKCVVRDRGQLDALLKENEERYHEDMLVEEYIGGREFTVGVLGNGDKAHVFEPMEIIFRHPTQDNFKVYSFGVKKEYKKHIEYRCPPELSEAARREIIETTRKIYTALGCRDFARVDYRMTEDGTLHFIEINPLPGLAPGYSDYPMLAGFCGTEYDKLVYGVLHAAMLRYGLTREVTE